MTKEINLSDLPPALVANPYATICEWAELKVKKMGRDVFRYLALLPVSIFIPGIHYEGKVLKCNMSFLLLTPPGGGKSMIADHLKDIAVNPYKFKKITPAEIQSDLQGEQNVTLIVDDVSIIFHDEELLKVIEGIIGEGRVEKRTMKATLEYDIVANAYFAGVPQDLTSYLSSGMLSRLTPMIIMHNTDVQNEIGKMIVGSLGKKEPEATIKTVDIKNYYQWLFNVQEGKDSKIPRIIGYEFKEEYKMAIYNSWVYFKEQQKTYAYENYQRELISGFKYMACSAFLNLPNRNYEGGILRPIKEDLTIALYLMQNEISTKIQLLRNKKVASKIPDVKALQSIAKKNNWDEKTVSMVRAAMDTKATN